MLTTLDITRLVPRQQSATGPNTEKPLAQRQHDGPVFTIAELLELLEDHPEIREALRQSLIAYTTKQAENKQ